MTEILAGIGALIAIVLAAWGKGRYDARKAAAEADKDRQAKTKERMDAVAIDDDPHVARDFLRERGQ